MGEAGGGGVKLLDLFCGAGGCTAGYQRAGFWVRGVDIKPQPRYVGEQFVQADALEYLQGLIESGEVEGFDAIHASPPCQFATRLRNAKNVKPALDLVTPSRPLLIASGLPWVMENVDGAPLLWPVCICGASFGLKTGHFDLSRHRFFESNIMLLTNHCTHRRGFTVGVYGNGTNKWHREKFGRCLRQAELCEAMGIDWMVRKELSQAIPPAYTEFIGRQLIAALTS
jgi:DNA (cytosine-5)-methyltransferase 1